MSESSPQITVYRVADLSPRKPVRFDLRPGKETCEDIMRDLGLSSLRKLSFQGELRAEGKTDWRLDARLGATATQPCVVSLEPVTTRIDTDITRRFLAKMPEDETGADDIEIPEDETIEPLGAKIDLNTVMIEALALALPDYPRHPDSSLDQTSFAGPGVAPMTDEDAKPFAGLAALRHKLGNGE